MVFGTYQDPQFGYLDYQERVPEQCVIDVKIPALCWAQKDASHNITYTHKGLVTCRIFIRKLGAQRGSYELQSELLVCPLTTSLIVPI